MTSRHFHEGKKEKKKRFKKKKQKFDLIFS